MTDEIEYSEEFERCFWRPWPKNPRKIGKGAAFRAWKKLDPSPRLAERIRTAIERDKDAEQWKRGFIPLPTTWLHQSRFDDDPGPAGAYDGPKTRNTVGPSYRPKQ